MKRFLAILFIALPILAGAQILKTPGIPHYGVPPMDPPTKQGSEIAVDTTNRIWQWDRQAQAWRKLGYALAQTVGCTPPVYTPSRTLSPFAINSCDSLYFYRSGAWHHLNKGAVASVNGQSGVVTLDLSLTGNTLALTGDGSAVDLSGYLDNTDAQSVDTFAIVSNTLRISISGDGVPFKSVSLSPYLDNTDAQNLSLSGQSLGISGGSGVTLPVVGISAGTGISASPSSGVYTITNTGDTDASDDITTSSTAGGDLTGTFSNLQIAANAVGTPEIASNAVTSGKIATGAVGASELASTAVTGGTYGSATQVAQATFDADGRATGASNVTIAIPSTAVTDFTEAAQDAALGNVNAGTGITVTYSDPAGTLTITNTLPDVTVSLTGAGINNVTGTYPNFTITGTEADGSTTNELQNLSLSGQSLGISSGTGVTLPIVGVAAGTGISVSTASGTATVTNTGDTNAGDDITTSTTAGGDLSGTYPNPTVAKIQGISVSTTDPTTDQILKFNGTAWAPANESGGGGGSSDALGTGFTSGGGSGTIPASTTAQQQGGFYIDNQDSYVFQVGDIAGVGSGLRLEVSPDGIALGNGAYFFGSFPGDGVMSLTAPGSIIYSGAAGAEVIINEAATAGFKITDNQTVKTGAYYADDYSATIATNDRSIPDVGTVKLIVQGGPPQYTTTERDALTPSEGWTIYNLTLHKLQVYDGTTWQSAW